MRVRTTAVFAVAAACACAGGPALAAVAGQGRSSAAPTTQTSPMTRPMTSTTGTDTTTNSTQTSTTPATPQNVCLAKARRAIARSLRVRQATVSVAIGEGTNGMPQCVYVVQHPRMKAVPHTNVHLTVNVDNGPQASWRLMRKVVEAGQLFGPAPPGWHAPVGLLGLGQYASWFISLHTLMCVNHTRTKLLSVTVAWRRADRGQMIALARAVAEPYIHAPAKAEPIPISTI